jgi:hypothetical protein
MVTRVIAVAGLFVLSTWVLCVSFGMHSFVGLSGLCFILGLAEKFGKGRAWDLTVNIKSVYSRPPPSSESLGVLNGVRALAVLW